MRIQYRSGDREAIDTTLDLVTADELAGSVPVREFRWYKGRKHYSGWYWSSTKGGLVVYENRRQRTSLSPTPRFCSRRPHGCSDDVAAW